MPRTHVCACKQGSSPSSHRASRTRVCLIPLPHELNSVTSRRTPGPAVSDVAWKKCYSAMYLFEGNAVPTFDQRPWRLALTRPAASEIYDRRHHSLVLCSTGVNTFDTQQVLYYTFMKIPNCQVSSHGVLTNIKVGSGFIRGTKSSITGRRLIKLLSFLLERFEKPCHICFLHNLPLLGKWS